MAFCTTTETCCTLKLHDDVTAVLDLINGFHPLLCIYSSKRDAFAKGKRVSNYGSCYAFMRTEMRHCNEKN